MNVLFHLTNRQRAKVTRLGRQCVNVTVGQSVNVFFNVGARFSGAAGRLLSCECRCTTLFGPKRRRRHVERRLGRILVQFCLNLVAFASWASSDSFKSSKSLIFSSKAGLACFLTRLKSRRGSRTMMGTDCIHDSDVTNRVYIRSIRSPSWMRQRHCGRRRTAFGHDEPRPRWECVFIAPEYLYWRVSSYGRA